MSDIPFFSVVIPTYNRKKFVSEAIQSVVDQSFKSFEIIVIDDGSSDGTEQLLKDLCLNVNYIKQKNSGVSIARNNGITHAKGKYICYLDSDDLWHRNKLSEIYNFIQKYPALDVLFHDFRKHNIKLLKPYALSNTDMFVYLLSVFKNEDKNYWLAKEGDAFYITMRGYPFYPSAVIVKADVHNHYRWDPCVLKSEDFNLMLKLSFKCRFGYLHNDLATIRVHDSNKSADTLTKDRVVLQTMKLLTNLYCLPEKQKIAKRLIAKKFFYSGITQIKAHNYKQGISWLLMALIDYNFYQSKLEKIFK